MLLALFGVLAAAPIYWFLVPEKSRKNYLALVSLLALGIYDFRLPLFLLVFITGVFCATRFLSRSDKKVGRLVLISNFAGLLALFLFNKLASGDDSHAVIATQGGLVLLGVSYFVLKAVAVLVDSFRGALVNPSWFSLARWFVFLPIYSSGPIEAFKHFDDQTPEVDRDPILRGFERILFGLVRALVLSHYLAEWANPILAAPQSQSPFILLIAAYAFTLRFYFDFAGYSDIAIGLAAVYGYKIQENFDNPLIQRNLAKLWQHFHITLTTWMRLYLFTPLSRAVMRRGGPHLDSAAIVAGQMWAMMFCGMWHGLSWEFALWGFCHALGLIWCNLGARQLGAYLPVGYLRWWRQSPIAYGMSCWLGVTTFAMINIIALGDIATTTNYFAHLLALR